MAPSDSGLRLYHALSTFKSLRYRGKLMAVAFVGIHAPLIALAVWYTFDQERDWRAALEVLLVTLVATLVGTAATLFVMGRLLYPVLLTSRALRAFREHREQLALPAGYTDEIGTLMDDTRATLQQLGSLLDRLTCRDEVSGLPNRRHFEQQLTDRLRGGQPLAVAVVQFDNLPRLLETLDLRRADKAVRMVAMRLAAQGEFADQLSCTAAASFACILPADAARAQGRLAAALQRCAQDLQFGDLALRPLLRVGVALYPGDAGEAAALVEAAAAAAAQAGTEAPVALHAPQALGELRLEHDLRRALEREEFSLQFQPVVDLRAGRVVGAEALLRWTHPVRGAIAPLSFIGVAESSGLIEPIGLWVLQQACAQLSAWNGAGLTGLRMSVNVSARQFLDPALRWQVIGAVQQGGIAPDQLEIELTETAAMVDHGHTQRVFTALRDAGVRIAIDDFGTGYASMSYLRKLPFDKLKIDREFVSDVHRQPQSQAICDALIALGRGLRLQVQAEGAEQREEMDYLAGRGCALFQGFYFSRPVTAAEFTGVAARWAERAALSPGRQ